MKCYVKVFLLISSISFVSHVVYNFFKKKEKKSEPRRLEDHSPPRKRPTDLNSLTEIHDVIMFSYGMVAVKKSEYSRCMITKSMEKLLYYLSTPRHTLDICMYVLTSADIANVILKLHFRGVKIRLIIDADMAFSTGSNVRKLEKQGIPVRWMKSTSLMHHKFCLLDASIEEPKAIATPAVMIGSLNWTRQGLNGNWEDVTVTSQKNIVRLYKEEFERLWICFKPIVDF